MEGFSGSEKKLKPTDEPKTTEGHTQKIEQASLSVRNMFNRFMETTGVVRRVTEENKMSFQGPEDRSL